MQQNRVWDLETCPVERRRVFSRTSYNATCAELKPEAVIGVIWRLDDKAHSSKMSS